VVQPGFVFETRLHRAVEAFIWYWVSTAKETFASLTLTAPTGGRHDEQAER
jgi:hypothetical protein